MELEGDRIRMNIRTPALALVVAATLTFGWGPAAGADEPTREYGIDFGQDGSTADVTARQRVPESTAGAVLVTAARMTVV